jgi:hypothetical protein
MKLYSKIISTLALVLALSFANCGGKGSGGSDANGLIIANFVGNLVRSAVSGNCVISLNLGSLYAGAILQGAANSATNFTEAEYLSTFSAPNNTLAAQGYTTFANVPYNRKYDAYLRTGGTTWTEARRNTSLATQKGTVDIASLVGAALLLTSSNATSGTHTTLFNGRTSTTDALATYYNAFTAAEKTALATAAGQTVAVLDTVLGLTGGTFQTQAQTLFGGVFCASLGGGNLTGGFCTPNILANYLAALPNFYNAYNARAAWRSGLALLACSRIPRSNCNLGALATANRASDISSAVSTYNAIFENNDCRKAPSGLGDFNSNLIAQLFVGLQRDITVTGLNGRAPHVNHPDQSFSEGTTSGTSANFSTHKILAEGAYPKIAALQNLSGSFASAFPMRTGNTPYPVTQGTSVATSQTAGNEAPAVAAGTIPWYGGSNINFNIVNSCESIGLGGVGPTPLSATERASTTSAQNAMNLRRPISPVNEVVYAFSTNGTAASEYATRVIGTVYSNIPSTGNLTSGLQTMNSVGTQNFNDAVACNNSFRSKTAIPAALGVGTKLPVISAPSADGSASSLLTACIYGGTTGTTGTRAVSGGLFAASALFGLSECPVAAAGAASTFGEFGLQSFGTAGFPNGRD